MVILVVAFATVGPVDEWYVLIGKIALELAIGVAIGLTVGFLGSYGLRHVALPASGLYPIAVMAIAVTAYAVTAMAHGSGFLAVYLAAMVLGNAKLPHWPATRGFADGLGWIAQIGMFVLLGLLVTPHELLNDFWPAVVIGLALTMVARPLSVFIGLLPFRLPWQEQALMSWAGLRGAVPIILATIPMVSGIEGSERVFNIVFVLVVVYTLVQGPTLPWLARKLNLRDNDEAAADLGIESAPLEKAARAPAVLRHPAGLADARRRGERAAAAGRGLGHAGGPGREELRTGALDRAAARGRAAGGGHGSGAGRGGGAAAGGGPGRQAGRLAGDGQRDRALTGSGLRTDKIAPIFD
ncbi:hypothetical protein GCM10020254_49950 [Streptomyces goshikiensis]